MFSAALHFWRGCAPQTVLYAWFVCVVPQGQVKENAEGRWQFDRIPKPGENNPWYDIDFL